MPINAVLTKPILCNKVPIFRRLWHTAKVSLKTPIEYILELLNKLLYEFEAAPIDIEIMKGKKWKHISYEKIQMFSIWLFTIPVSVDIQAKVVPHLKALIYIKLGSLSTKAW